MTCLNLEVELERIKDEKRNKRGMNGIINWLKVYNRGKERHGDFISSLKQ